MALHKIAFSHRAETHITNILNDQLGQYSPSDRLAYTQEIERRCHSLSENPKRFSFDEYTKHNRTYRSFEHKAHKVFYQVDDGTFEVVIAAILPSRTKYSAKL